MAATDILSLLLGPSVNSVVPQQMVDANQEAMAHMYESIAPFSLGTYTTKENKKRTRKEIYTKWEQMLKFAPIAEGIGIHVMAALGGDTHNGQQIFITPSERLRGKEISVTEKAQLKKLEARIKPIENIVNKYITKLCSEGISFGDAYARVYGEKKVGITDLLSNEYTYPPQIEAYEQGSKTVAYFGLDPKNWSKVITKLNKNQMVRMKLPRIQNVPQFNPVEASMITRMLENDDPEQLPILPSQVGGSFLYTIEKAYDDVILALTTMNSQQVADAVNQMFLTLNMSGMPPAQREAYTRGLEGMLRDHEKFVKNALEGGESIWNTKYHVLPTWDEKQVLNPVGDIKGQRNSPINIETFMINVRILMGGIGLDPSLVGWADMLAGGLGDGAAFHTSSQIMRRSMYIRQSAVQLVNMIMCIDWGLCYNEDFDERDFPWQVEFSSTQSAAVTEENTNKQTQMNTTLLKIQVINSLKESDLSEETMQYILEKDAGFNYDDACRIAKDIAETRAQAQSQAQNMEQ
ncbi:MULTISPECIES: hypothetical protein [unclassified Acinetobacter]|uniref:hypothetical protein n=1 Tax=unclassified Acinetobacter TaxID=196816 RepID=UPI00244CA0F2|nr:MULTISPECIES: hypothetical protein [unclassified Acinetobacter]MDH0032913.1 hypothetical protein [Acinetobacter sp. GD04021]MDH0887308.1 hypothetical protein [Acinetobacter sp. GD03873]MDH1084704.1 hypothetical protein [Acinetobacter sp. GD03983]MDH2190624.1 hypothetical protein [Acinetobacter sp. GD03645]MDH2205082.1 hypothetical protein [Acinetobacter sp. GD03647]